MSLVRLSNWREKRRRNFTYVFGTAGNRRIRTTSVDKVVEYPEHFVYTAGEMKYHCDKDDRWVSKS